MKKASTIISIILIVISFSCSTDFDINAEWKDVPVVYSVLNQSDAVHYIKINKSFLGGLSAYEMAQTSDSLFYGDLEVYIDKYVNHTLSKTFTFTKTTDIQKDTGIFANDKNIIYKNEEDLISSSDKIEDCVFKLKIINPKNGKEIIGETKLIDDLNIIRPQSGPLQMNFSIYESNYKVEWSSATNAKQYNTVVKIHYFELPDNTEDTTDYYIYWHLPSKIDESNARTLNVEYQNSGFYNTIASNVSVKPSNIRRYLSKVDPVTFMFSMANNDLFTYIEVSSPSNGIVQEKPEFTNLENAIGIFAARSSKELIKKVRYQTIDSLANGIYTKKLNFANYDDPYYVTK